jgi:hypothetical protein
MQGLGSICHSGEIPDSFSSLSPVDRGTGLLCRLVVDCFIPRMGWSLSLSRRITLLPFGDLYFLYRLSGLPTVHIHLLLVWV